MKKVLAKGLRARRWGENREWVGKRFFGVVLGENGVELEEKRPKMTEKRVLGVKI
jgi:hypothetical protein